MNVSPYILPGLKFNVPLARAHEETIQKVLDHYHVDLRQLQSRKRYQHLVTPRHVLMSALYLMHHWSLKRVGEFFNRDHTSVIHALQNVKNFCLTDEDYKKQVEFLFPSLVKSLENKKDYNDRNKYKQFKRKLF